MSNHKDNNANTRLRDFLDSAKKSSDSDMDDFEREALEGFESIKTPEEIMAIKAQLDKRAENEIFAKEKKSPQVFWYAAAGLVLIIGFSVYFIKNDPSTKRNDLAIQQKNEVLSAVEEAPKKEMVEESLAESISVDSSPTFKKDQQKVESTKSIPLKSSKNLEVEVEAEADMQASAPPSTEEMEDVSYAASSVNATNTSTILAKKDNVQVAHQEAKKKNPAAGAVSPAAAPQNEMIVSTLYEDEKEEEEKNASMRKSSKKSEARSKQANAAVVEDSFVSSCYYTGGEEVLLKDLRLLLKENNLLVKFNATLFINENKKVEKVVITNSFGLTESQQEKVKEVLKQLSQFNLNNPGSSRSLAEYQLMFIP